MKRAISIILVFVFAIFLTSALGDDTSSYEELSKGSKGDAVKALQTRLKELGYYTMGIDGDYGNGTSNAVSAFQARNGLLQNGIATVETLTALFDDNAIPAPKESDGIVVAFEKREYTVLKGKTITVKPVVQGTNKSWRASYSSSDETIATVNNEIVSALATGTVIISCTVSIGNDTFECSYTLVVQQPVEEIVLGYSEVTLPSNCRIQSPTITVLPIDASNPELECTVSDLRIACFLFGRETIETSRKAGTATITWKATDGSGVEASLKITVPTVAWFSIDKEITIDTPDGITFYYVPTMGSGFNTTKSYCSNDVINARYLGSDDYALEQFLSTQAFDKIEYTESYYHHMKIEPQKVGTGLFVVDVNGKTESIKITVTRSAIYESIEYDKLFSTAQIDYRYTIDGKITRFEYVDDSIVLLFATDGDEAQPAILITDNEAHFDEDSLYSDYSIKGVLKGYQDIVTETGLTKTVPVLFAEEVKQNKN